MLSVIDAFGPVQMQICRHEFGVEQVLRSVYGLDACGRVRSTELANVDVPHRTMRNEHGFRVSRRARVLFHTEELSDILPEDGSLRESTKHLLSIRSLFLMP